MSKQLKYRFKKTLKKADFVHADLEYHKELIPEAQKLFFDTIAELIAVLPEEDQEQLKKIDQHKQEMFQQHILENINKQKEAAVIEESRDVEEGGTLVPTDIEVIENPQEQVEKRKLIELKKLFHRIAEQTHPDKMGASGFSHQEIQRLEKVFKKALSAYHENNWYILYSIAIDLGLEIGGLDQEHIDWVEDDIRNTLSEISQIGRLLAWIWYTGDPGVRGAALKDYFQQIYGVNCPGL